VKLFRRLSATNTFLEGRMLGIPDLSTVEA